MERIRIRVWDLPIRIFHWSLVALIIAAILTGKTGGNAMSWHGKIGLAILGLIAFRVVWGFAGSQHARFKSFLPTPASILAYLKGNWRGIGHNPLGALSVVAMLTMIGLQVATGLLANDDIAFKAPLFSLVDKETSDSITGAHTTLVNALIALIALHLGAILFHAMVKKDNLVKAMITGRKEIDITDAPTIPPASNTVRALLLALAIAGFTVYAGSGAWLPTLMPRPLQTYPTPSW